ncbi:MAG: hypothetical protein ABSH14_10850 [Verrucomicrobiia bacterium]
MEFDGEVIRAGDPVDTPAVVGTTFNSGHEYQELYWNCYPWETTEDLGSVDYSPNTVWSPNSPVYLNPSTPGIYNFNASVYGISSDSACPYTNTRYVETYTVTVVGVSSVAADADVVCAGGSVTLTAYPYPDVDWPDGTPTWTVNPSSAGSMAAGAGGTAIFTAASSFSGSVTITAHCGTSEQDYTLTDSEMSIGSTLYYPVVDVSDDTSLKLTASGGTAPYTWTTSDPSIATAPVFILSMPADDICEIIGHGPGSADITATDHKGCKATRTVTIIQLTSSQSDLWWFNGATPANYALSTVLTAVGTTTGTFRWDIVSGADKVILSKGTTSGSSITVNDDNTVNLTTIGFSTAPRDVVVQFSYNGRPTSTKSFTVSVPMSATLMLGFPVDVPYLLGYKSTYRFIIADYFGNPMPNPLQMNEVFGSWVPDQPNSSWPSPTWTPTTTLAATPDEFGDVYGASVAYIPLIYYPSTVCPTCPNADEHVKHAQQLYYAGSLSAGQGVLIDAHNVQYNRGNGRQY